MEKFEKKKINSFDKKSGFIQRKNYKAYNLHRWVNLIIIEQSWFWTRTAKTDPRVLCSNRAH